MKKRTKPKKYVSYPLVVEDEIMDYIEAHQCLYKHKLRDFWNAELKNLAWQRLLEQINSNNENLNINMEDLLGWYKNVQREFGQIKKAMIKSGDGGLLGKQTEKQEWMWVRCQFLSSHIIKKVEPIESKSKGVSTQKLHILFN